LKPEKLQSTMTHTCRAEEGSKSRYPPILPTALIAVVELTDELARGINWLGEHFEACDLTE
jgi:hypothetical protein